MTRLVLCLLACAGHVWAGEGRDATGGSGTAPRLGAAFYNLWASQIDWTAEQWEEDLGYMKSLGIEWAFITYTACDDHETNTAYCWTGGRATNETQTLYKSRNPAYIQVGDDVLGKFLAAATKLELKVLVGLLLVPMPDTDVVAIGELYVELVADLYSGYGHFQSFAGYYLTQEWGWREGDFAPARADLISQHFIGPISDKVHALQPSLEVGLSPSLDGTETWQPCPAAAYNDYTSYVGCGGQPKAVLGNWAPPSAWAAWWVRALADAPHFSWLFVQDHRGGGEPPQHIRGYLRALSAAMRPLKVKNWANAEFFHAMRIGNPPANYGEGNQTRTVAPIDRVHRQLLEEAPLVSGFTCWEFHWYLSPAGGVQMHRASRDDSLHSNKSLTLYRNYQRTVMTAGAPLLLITSNHEYQYLTAPAAAVHPDGNTPTQPPQPGVLTDGLAYSQSEGCVRFTKSTQPSRVRLNLTTSAEQGLLAPFRLASGFRAYFLNLESQGAAMPDSVVVECSFGWSSMVRGPTHANRTIVLVPVTKYPSNGKMVIYDAHILDDMIEATSCEFKIEHRAAAVLLAEIEVYE